MIIKTYDDWYAEHLTSEGWLLWDRIGPLYVMVWPGDATDFGR